MQFILHYIALYWRSWKRLLLFWRTRYLCIVLRPCEIICLINPRLSSLHDTVQQEASTNSIHHARHPFPRQPHRRHLVLYRLIRQRTFVVANAAADAAASDDDGSSSSMDRDTTNMSSKMSSFVRSEPRISCKISSKILIPVQVSSSHWKVFNLQTDKYVLNSKSVKRSGAFLYITINLFNWKCFEHSLNFHD